jgi:Ca2+/Na+ antiporter
MLASLFKNNNTFINESLGIIDGLFLLFLALSGNFLAETLGCQTQELLSNSIVAKQAMTFFIIFFTIDYSDKDIESPSAKLIKAFLVYIFFLLFTKMDIKPTIFVLMLLVGVYVSNSYKKFYKAKFKQIKKPKKHDIAQHNKQIDTISNTQKGLMVAVVVVILGGFVIYYREKKEEYNKIFDFKKFIFGVVKCKGMN